MKSIMDIYRIGRGPSSSHTMGPESAARLFASEHPEAERFTVRLYGSLCLTGEGHGTDRVLRETLAPRKTEIVFVRQADSPLPHPNTLDFLAYRGDVCTGRMRVMSVGGGEIEIEGRDSHYSEELYPHASFHEIADYCINEKLTLPQYVRRFDRPESDAYLERVWETMKKAVAEGIAARGELPGGLHTRRKAGMLYEATTPGEDELSRSLRLMSAYAFAVSEQNAAGGIIVTAPTCGSCGVLPAVLLQAQEQVGYSDREIVDALTAAGIIGNLVRTNASVSGAECGCQAEIGTACSMAAAALAQLRHFSLCQIEYAAETAMEHQIGLTCDPVCGLVQIPCIERNSVAAQRAVHAALLAGILTGTQKISLDCIIENMYITGRDLQSAYRETATGGLAKLYRQEEDGI